MSGDKNRCGLNSKSTKGIIEPLLLSLVIVIVVGAVGFVLVASSVFLLTQLSFWWISVAFLLASMFIDSLLTAGLRLCLGEELFTEFELNKVAVRYVKRYGLVGAFLMNVAPMVIGARLLIATSVAAITAILLALGMADFHHLIVAPPIILGSLLLAVGGVGNVCVILLMPLLEKYRLV